MKVIKLFLLALALSVVFLLILSFFILTDYTPPCRPFKANILGREINFLLTMREAVPTYNLNYKNYLAHSNLDRDTIMVVVTNGIFTSKLMKGYSPDSLGHPVYGFLFYLKKPSDKSILDVRANIEKEYGGKFEKKKAKYSNAFYYYLKVNDCVQITITPETSYEFLFSTQNTIRRSDCLIGIYYNLTDSDIEDAAISHGTFGD